MIKQSVFLVVGTVVALCVSSVTQAGSISSPDILKISVPGGGGEATASPFQILPLHSAALHDNASWMARLIDSGMNVDTRDADGRTPLMVAAAFNSLEVARLLLSRGADPKAADNAGGYTPLHFAAGYGHVEILNLLLSAGADISVSADDGQTPLHLAALHGRLKTIRALSEKGIDPNIADAKGVTPIQYATIRLQTAAVDLLGSLGARSDNLFDAVNAGDVARVQSLLANGADVNSTDVFGTALHRAVAAGQVYIANMLIDAGADLEAGGDPAQSHPLHLAALKNDAAMASLLIDRGAEIDSADSWGRTPLMIAAANRGVNVAEVLLDAGADLTAEETVYHDTAIHYATLAGDTEMVGLFLAQGVDVDLISGHSGESPLRYAAQTGNPRMIELLLKVGADSGIRDRQGHTPLDVAVSRAKGSLAVPVLRRLAGQ